MDSPAPIGHNIAPLITGEELEKYLATEYGPTLARAEELLAAESRFINVGTDQADADATEFMVKVRTGWKTAEAGRVKEKAPYDTAAGLVHAFFKTRVLDPLEALGARLNVAQTDYKKGVLWAELETRAAEARRLQKEEADRQKAADDARKLAEEAAQAAARARKPERVAELTAAAQALAETAATTTAEANRTSEARAEAEDAASAPAADMTRNRGKRGGVSSLATLVAFRDLNVELLGAALDAAGKPLKWPKGVTPPGILELLPYIKEAHLEAAVRDYVKGNRASVDRHIEAGTQPIPGVVFYTDYQNRGRA